MKIIPGSKVLFTGTLFIKPAAAPPLVEGTLLTYVGPGPDEFAQDFAELKRDGSNLPVYAALSDLELA